MFLRKIAVLTASFLFSAASFGQPAPAITGVGEFKIGMSLDEFIQLPSISSKKTEDRALGKLHVGADEVWITTTDSKWDMFKPFEPQSSASDRLTAALVERQRVYSSEITILNVMIPVGVPKIGGVDSYEATMHFYKGKLASIKIRDASNEFKQIVESKYGKPSSYESAKRIVCQNGNGVKSEQFDGHSSTKWGKGTIKGEFLIGFMDCGSSMYSYYEVYNEPVMKIVEKIQDSGLANSESNKSKSKASASKL